MEVQDRLKDPAVIFEFIYTFFDVLMFVLALLFFSISVQ